METITIVIARRGGSKTCSISASWSGDGGAPHGYKTREQRWLLPEGLTLDPSLCNSLVSGLSWLIQTSEAPLPFD